MASNIEELMLGKRKKTKKRVKLTPKQRIYIWENPKIYGRTCSICHRRITRLSDLELDHTKPFSKGGKKLALAHRDCNRMKASGSLRKIQTTLGIKTKKTRRKRVKKKSGKKYYIEPITGMRVPVQKEKYPFGF
jgi:5-methylcytosine-specific restriction endonuclease McrA